MTIQGRHSFTLLTEEILDLLLGGLWVDAPSAGSAIEILVFIAIPTPVTLPTHATFSASQVSAFIHSHPSEETQTAPPSLAPSPNAA